VAKQTESCRAGLLTVSGQFSCPPRGSFMAVSGPFLVCPLSHYRTFEWARSSAPRHLDHVWGSRRVRSGATKKVALTMVWLVWSSDQISDQDVARRSGTCAVSGAAGVGAVLSRWDVCDEE
jgi:hypothetical protein